MVKDRKAVSTGKNNQFFALKVQKSAEHYTEAAMDEVELLDCISNERKKCEQIQPQGGKDSDGVAVSDVVEFSQYVATLHDSFFHTGPNGRHMCMVFSMLGCNLLSVIKAYNYRGIPIPVVKNMIKGICRGLDFLHRKCQIIHTDLKPENVLLLYEGTDTEDEDLKNAVGSLSIDDKSQSQVGQTIAELEAALQNPNLTQDERKKIRRRLKKKRQKERKRASGGGAAGGDSDGSSDGDDDETADDDGGHDKPKESSSSFLSDWEMSKILSKAANMITSPSGSEIGNLESTSTNPVKRRLSHSAFVTSNFGHRQECADAKLVEVLRETVEVRRPSVAELEADFITAESNGGVAEVAFMLRAFTPEEELADGLTSALGGVKWEKKPGDDSTREW